VINLNINWKKYLDHLRKEVPVKTGALQASWYLVNSGVSWAVYESKLKYARIQDQGGSIPPVFGKLMVFETSTGKVFPRKRRGVTIKGNQYSSKAFAALAEGGF
jgi:hypothetical protein